MLKFLVVEDHALVREGLVRLLKQIDDEVVVIEAGDGEAALIALTSARDFDLVLTDLAMPNTDGFSTLDIVRERHPDLPVAVISAYDDQPTITRVLNHGASGFIPKAYSGEALLEAVRSILAGNIYTPSPSLAAKIDDVRPLAPCGRSVTPSEIGLTDRQAQVLALMIRGLANRDIAKQLDLSEGTVKIHATAIFKALGVNSRAQAMVTATTYNIDFDNVF